MSVNLRHYYSRQKRSSELWHFIGQLVLMILSTAPIAFMIWWMNEAGVFSPQTPYPLAQEIPQHPRVVPRVERSPPKPDATKHHAREQPAEYNQPPPVRRPQPKKQSPELRIRYGEDYPDVPENALLAALALAATYRIEPSSGELPARVRITGIMGGEVNILVAREGDSIRTEATIKIAGKDVAFTAERMERMRATLIRKSQAISKRIARLNAEKEQLKAAVLAPITKPLAWRGMARTRIMVLNKLISAGESQHTQISAEIQAVESMLHLAEDLDNCELIFKLSDDP